MKTDNSNSNIFDSITIGIIGCGHLGQAILQALVTHECNKNNIYVSYNGAPPTFEKLKKSGFSSCISENKSIFDKADVVFLTVKPQDIKSLSKILIPKHTIVVSCLAGMSIEILKIIFNRHIF